ncbi:NAD(P)H-hydrate dehydratase [Candidatus Roizmanbacteria bacterium]|jgi:NAD(P)H-hydrate epimerase|nr:NAD(P)H-hydrate dehydratase [Candidatus Roizmanbacteria bacterium]
MQIKTENVSSIKPFLKGLELPLDESHKGQNGRLLIIGGSTLFHSASIWAAEIASHFSDMVHYSSTEENNEIIVSLKKKFQNGMVVNQKHLIDYVKEDDTVLIGPGMVRTKIANNKSQIANNKFEEILKIEDEGMFTYHLTKYFIESFPEKKFVFDAGALQMMDKNWLLRLKTVPILTPHQKEFEKLFGINLLGKSISEKKRIVKETAKAYSCVIILKAVVDFVSDGFQDYIVEGGNQGLTKGGTGDILAGLAASFYSHGQVMSAAVTASFLLKKTADELFAEKGYWYNIDDLIEMIPETFKKMIL